jgi:hypothetical protein
MRLFISSTRLEIVSLCSVLTFSNKTLPMTHPPVIDHLLLLSALKEEESRV